MTSRSKQKPIDRRQMLRGATATSAAGAAFAALRPTEAQAYTPPPQETAARYRESDHVKAFYRTNGYETLKKK